MNLRLFNNQNRCISNFTLRQCGFGLAAVCLLSTGFAAPVHPTLPFAGCTVVDEIDCSVTPAANQFYEEGPDQTSKTGTAPIGTVTQIQTILGSPARVLPNPPGSVQKYFAYRIGQGKNLVAGKAYVLEVEYPEDAPRSMVIINTGEATARGFFTGACVGDALHPPNVNPNSESLDIPVAGTWKTWRSLFHLHDRFTGVQRISGAGLRAYTPADGFYVVVAHYWNKDEPLSQGAAVRKIRLLEAPPLATYDAGLRLPPQGLPRRHIFTREEMYDGTSGLGNDVMEDRGVATTVNYYEYKARLMKYLGMNTFTKDLLEFGGNQGFDSTPGGGNSWYYTAKEPGLWDAIVTMLGGYDLDVMPYYEYSGSEGANGLGNQRRAKPLNANLSTYTQISWAEATRADLSDADTHADAKLLLDTTMTRYRNKVNFIGAWFRARVSAMPISFSDANITQFSKEVLGGQPISRAQLQTTTGVYEQYKAWFLGKRRGFIDDMRDYMRGQGINKDAVMLYTSDASEPGHTWSGASDLIAETAAPWTAVNEPSVPLTQAVSQAWQWKALTTPRSTYSGWEWQHADVYNDPAAYAAENGSMLTYTFNKAYTLGNPAWLSSFRTQGGLAMVRHFALNENTLNSPSGYTPVITNPLGYFICDMERTGPFTMMAEALALAHGDPYYFGYLSSTTVNRGFAEYVRAFNQAYLALPAVPSTLGTSSNPNVVVRNYSTDGFGTYVAVVNTARTDQNGAVVTLPFQADVIDATTGSQLASSVASISFDLYPFQARALLLKKHTASGPQAVDDSVNVNEGSAIDVNVVGNDTGPGTKTLTALGAPGHGSVAIVANQAHYVPAAGFYGSDSFSYTVSNGSETDSARVSVTVNNTQVAGNLDSWGLVDTNIGGEDTGRSRLLSGGTIGEVTGFGAGATGMSDLGHFVSQSVSGDFQVTVKVNSVAGTAADAVGGLMVRQSNEAGARMVTALIDSTGSLFVRSRSNKAGGVNGTTFDASMEVTGAKLTTGGASWIRIKRTGDLVTVEKSNDNASYTEVAWRNLPGLPATLTVGMWVAGGDRYTGSRALMQAFNITNTTTDALFAQDFSSSTNVASYINASGAANTWGDLSAEVPEGGTWIVDSSGALKLTTTTGTSSNNDAGFTRTAALAPLGSVLKFSTMLGVTNSDSSNSYSDFGSLDFGNFTSKIDYGSATPASNLFAQVILRGAGVGLFRFKLDSTSVFYDDPVDGHFIADGRLYRLTLYFSQSATDQTYFGPDGLVHTLTAGMASLWMNDRPVKENWSRTALTSATASAPSTFKFRESGAFGRIYRFDDMMLEARMAAPTPVRGNTTPIAVNDSAVMNEGGTCVLDVLANDTDADDGPDGLRITNVTPSTGVAAVKAGMLEFTPAPGFTGVASVGYTITDGIATASGTANITVNSTASASNLTSAGLTGSAIGSGSVGGSRILSNGYWELTQTGGAGTDVADKMWFEQKSVAGDFVAEGRIGEMQSLGTGACGGLMIRESSATGSRLALACLDASDLAKAIHRLTLNGSAVTGGSTSAVTYPGAWVQLQRSGTTITVRVSSDGVSFTDLESVQIPNLAGSVQVGLWTTNARMVATGFVVRPYQSELLKMDFNSSTSVSAYVQELDPEPNQVSDISAEVNGGVWSVDAGRLRIVRTADTGADCGAGLVRTSPFAGPPTALKMSFDLSLSNSSTSTSADMFYVEFGNFLTLTDYNSSIVSAPIHDRLGIRSRGVGKYAFRINGVNSADYTADGTPVTVTYYVNNAASPVSYQTPDGTWRTLGVGQLSLWVGGANGSLLFNSVTKEAGLTSTSIANFRFRMVGASYTAWIDNLIVTDKLQLNTNLAPVAVDDAVTLSESTSVDVNVVGNDYDPDNQPQAVTLTGVGSAAHGTTTIVSGKVHYVPERGYYGSDTVNYTISDGVASTTGTVNFTVNNTALAMDLSAFGMGSPAIGTSSGGSRELSTHQWEVTGAGAGLSGTGDAFQGQLQSVCGDFTMVVKTDELQGAAGTRLGLVAREGFAAGDRMVGISIGLDGTVKYVVRSTAGGTATETAVSGTFPVSGTWLMIKKVGNTLSAATSSDDVTYTQVVTQNLSQLSSTLQAGLWVAGGSGGATGRGVVNSFAVEQDTVNLAQNFDAWGTAGVIADYINSTPAQDTFQDISAEVDGGTWSIESTNDVGTHYNGKLKLVRAASTGANNAAGFTRLSGTLPAMQKLVVSFKVSVSGINTNSDLGYLDLANLTALQDYSATSPSAGMTNRLTLKGGGNGTFKIQINSVNSGTYAANGTEIQVKWYLNHSGSTVSYTGPDLSAQSLAAGTGDLWINGVRIFDDAGRNAAFLGTTTRGVRFRTTTDQPMVLRIDDLDLSQLP